MTAFFVNNFLWQPNEITFLRNGKGFWWPQQRVRDKWFSYFTSWPLWSWVGIDRFQSQFSANARNVSKTNQLTFVKKHRIRITIFYTLIDIYNSFTFFVQTLFRRYTVSPLSERLEPWPTWSKTRGNPPAQASRAPCTAWRWTRNTDEHPCPPRARCRYRWRCTGRTAPGSGIHGTVRTTRFAPWTTTCCGHFGTFSDTRCGTSRGRCCCRRWFGHCRARWPRRWSIFPKTSSTCGAGDDWTNRFVCARHRRY